MYTLKIILPAPAAALFLEGYRDSRQVVDFLRRQAFKLVAPERLEVSEGLSHRRRGNSPLLTFSYEKII